MLISKMLYWQKRMCLAMQLVCKIPWLPLPSFQSHCCGGYIAAAGRFAIPYSLEIPKKEIAAWRAMNSMRRFE